MLCKESKTRVRPRDSKVNGVRKAANLLNLALVIVKPAERQAERVFSVRKPKDPGQPRWKSGLKPRSDKPGCLIRQRAASPLRVANELSNKRRHNAVRKVVGPMLLRAHAAPAPLRTSASEAPLASNARPTPEILAPQGGGEAFNPAAVAVGAFAVVEAEAHALVAAAVASAVAVAAEVDADD